MFVHAIFNSTWICTSALPWQFCHCYCWVDEEDLVPLSVIHFVALAKTFSPALSQWKQRIVCLLWITAVSADNFFSTSQTSDFHMIVYTHVYLLQLSIRTTHWTQYYVLQTRVVCIIITVHGSKRSKWTIWQGSSALCGINVDLPFADPCWLLSPSS